MNAARGCSGRARVVLHAMERHLTPDGFLQSAHAAWLFPDWTDLPKKGILLVIQSLYLLALESAADLGRALGDHDEAKRFADQAERSRQLADAHFWDPAAGCYADAFADGALTPNGSRHANAFAVFSGIAGPGRAGRALQTARANPAAPAAGTPYMRYFESAAYCHAGLPEAKWSVVTRYWGGMLREGATMFWEAYDAKQTGNERYAFYGRPFGKSLCHAWASGPLALYSSELFGLKPVAPGWRTFTFSPAAMDALPWAAVCVPTPACVIRAEFEGERAGVEVSAGCAVMDAMGAPICSAPVDRAARFLFRRRQGKWQPVAMKGE